MLVDEAASVAKKYNVAGLPASFFIDADGNILASEVGWVKEDKIIEIFNLLTESS
jgi:thioredoxin-related protein